MVWFILIIVFLYIITGLVSNIINICKFFEEKFNDDDPYEEYKKKKLNE